ncbi:MAG: hypothetical protein ACXWL5_03255 [Candidatus Chromulinivorax sp.]
MKNKFILSCIVFSFCVLKSSTSSFDGLNLLVEAIKRQEKENYDLIKDQRKKERTDLRRETILAQISQDTSLNQKLKKRYWTDNTYRNNKLQYQFEKYYENKKNKEDNQENKAEERAALSIDALNIATSMINIENISNENNKKDKKLEERIANRKKIASEKIKQFSIKYKKNEYTKQSRNPNFREADYLKYWADDEARERKLAKMREKYAKKQALKKALLSTSALNT